MRIHNWTSSELTNARLPIELAVHMEAELPWWNIDCEYDRYGEVQKLLEGIRECDERRKTDRILPDIIIHRRGGNEPGDNLLVVELKKDVAEDHRDFEKLRGMTDQGGTFRYRLGLYININHGRFDCAWFKNGTTIS
jgi:hypothetical protein